MKDGQQASQPFSLSRSTGVARQSVIVQPTLIADADGIMVVRHGVSPYFQQQAMLCHRTVASDIEVIPNLAEVTRTMVTEQLLHSVVLVDLVAEQLNTLCCRLTSSYEYFKKIKTK